MMMFTFSIFDQKYSFLVNLVQEIKIVTLIYFFFRLEIPLLSDFGQKIHNCQSKLKFVN